MTLDQSRRLHLHDMVCSTAGARVLYGRVVAFNAIGAPVITFEDESHATIVFPSQADRLRYVPHWKTPANPALRDRSQEDDAA
jgi:hypothetical protein